MKTIVNFINEKLILNKQSQLYKYNYFPKYFDELRSLLEQLLEERGKDADLNDIDVSKVTSFGDKIKNGKCKEKYGLFYGLDPHNIDISKWNVSNVKNMQYMFYDCYNFDCNLSRWNVSNVKNMECMFSGCKRFEGKGLENWKPIKCQNMYCMFVDCYNFDCDLSNWNVSKVKDMQYMFSECTSLKNRPSWYQE